MTDDAHIPINCGGLGILLGEIPAQAARMSEYSRERLIQEITSIVRRVVSGPIAPHGEEPTGELGRDLGLSQILNFEIGVEVASGRLIALFIRDKIHFYFFATFYSEDDPLPPSPPAFRSENVTPADFVRAVGERLETETSDSRGEPLNFGGTFLIIQLSESQTIWDGQHSFRVSKYLIQSALSHAQISTGRSHELIQQTLSHAPIHAGSSHEPIWTTLSYAQISTGRSHELIQQTLSHAPIHADSSYEPIWPTLSHAPIHTERSHGLVQQTLSNAPICVGSPYDLMPPTLSHAPIQAERSQGLIQQTLSHAQRQTGSLSGAWPFLCVDLKSVHSGQQQGWR